MVASNDRKFADDDSQSSVSLPLDDEALVAYLDGELTGDQVATVELGLQANGELRDRLGQLKQAWEMLEELPEEKLSQTFSQATMERIALSEQRSLASGRFRLELLRTVGILALACLSFMLVAFFATRQFQRGANRQALNDLPILADWIAFKNIDSVEWLQKLEGLEDLQTVAWPQASSAEPSMKTGLGVDKVPLTPAMREEWVAGLSDAEHSQLAANRDDFMAESPQRRDEIRKIVNLAYESPESAEKYLKIVRAYRRVLANLSGKDKNKLADSSIDERLETLTRIINGKMVDVHRLNLPDEDRKAISNWLIRMEEFYGSELPRVPGGSQAPGARAWFDLYPRMASSSIITDDDLDELKETLSLQAQTILSKLGNSEAEGSALFVWLGDVVWRPFGGSQNALTGNLRTEYEKLDEVEKELLEYKSINEVHDYLLPRTGPPSGGRRGRGRGPRFGPPLNSFQRPSERLETPPAK